MRKQVSYHDASGAKAWEMMRGARAHLHDRFIVVAADLLVDQRLLAWLSAQTTDVILSPRVGDRPATAAFLRAESLEAPSAEAAHIKVVEAASLPAYWESMHGEVPIHLRRIASERDAEEAGGFFSTIFSGARRSCLRAISIRSLKT